MYITINGSAHLDDFKFYTIWQSLWVANEVLGFDTMPEIDIEDGKLVIIESFPCTFIKNKRKDLTFSMLNLRREIAPQLKKWGYIPKSKSGLFSLEEIANIDPWKIEYSVKFWNKNNE